MNHDVERTIAEGQYHMFRQILIDEGLEPSGYPPVTDLKNISDADLRAMTRQLRDLARTPHQNG